MVFGKKKGKHQGTTIFFATDLHGSTTCFKKFLNAPDYYARKGSPVDVLLMGGDVAGKLIVPVLSSGGHLRAHLTGVEYDMTSDEDLAAFNRSCETLGVYPKVFSPEEYEAFAADKSAQDALFKELIIERLQQWVDHADTKLADSSFVCYMSPGNDDFAEVDDVLVSSKRIVVPDGRRVLIDDQHEMISTGLSNLTPFNCPRDVPEEQLLERLEELAAEVDELATCIFNIHVPPLGTGIDEAPKLDAELRPEIGAEGVVMTPVGSTAVRDVITRYQPLLALHGHIHESKGAAQIGRTLCLNPGSEYSEGVLRGILVTVDGDRVVSHMMTSG